MKIKILNNLKLSLITIFLFITFSSVSLSEQKTQFLCENEILDYLIFNDIRNLNTMKREMTLEFILIMHGIKKIRKLLSNEIKIIFQ